MKNIIFDLHGVLFEKVDSENFKPIQEGVDLLKKFSSHISADGERTYKLFVCSNWDDTVLTVLKNDYIEIMGLFEGIVNPSNAGARKPNAEIFEWLTKNYCLNSWECVLIDDQEKNIRAAEAFGMFGIHVKNFDYVAHILKTLKFF